MHQGAVNHIESFVVTNSQEIPISVKQKTKQAIKPEEEV
jgi:hypothetical protein